MSRASSSKAGRRHRGERGVSIALQEAIHAHQLGHLDLAEPLYRKALELHPGQPDALHFFGVLCHQRGRSEEGVGLIRMALRAIPLHADAHNNLGNIHKESGNLVEAEACYRKALSCASYHHDALSNLALVLEAQERTEEAFEVYETLLAHAGTPQLARANYLMGLYLSTHARTFEDVEHAVVCFRASFKQDNRDMRTLELLGIALYMLGRRDEAIEVYRDWIRREPDNPVARHMLASCGGEVAPPRADDAYVRKVFDSFASSFDEQLLNKLAYRAPQILVEALAQILDPPCAGLDVLDAGCGTGLCGPLIRPYARRLSGVDLSGGMIEKARVRGGYDELTVAELTAYLQASPDTWDLVLSADTLVYFGDLQAVLCATYAALRPGGWLGFTLEALNSEEDRAELSHSGRYQHTLHYVQHVLDTNGFTDVKISPESLRKEMGVQVAGWVVLARKGKITSE